MEPLSPSVAVPRRTVSEVLKSYFYWTYQRGSFHYDVMVTLILLFIFVTPHLWNYGDKPSQAAGPPHPIQVIGDGDHGLIITVMAVDVNMPASASDPVAKKVLRKAIEPVTGDAVSIQRWELARDAHGNPVAWRVWAHR
jgi:hypothetical protein